MGLMQETMPAAMRAVQLPFVKDNDLQLEFLQHGRQSSAYFLFQKGVKCFHSPHGGRIHYAPQSTPLGEINFVMTNPLCEPERMGSLIQEFDASTGRVPNLYVAVDRLAAEPLRTMGYSVNEIGVECKVNLDDFGLSGRPKKQLRHASNFGKRTGCTVKELSWDEVDNQQVWDISVDWIHSKVINNREIRYSTRPAVFDDEWQVRKFYCMHGDQIIGYAFFDPYFEEGRIKGYCANILRARKEHTWNAALDFTVLEAMKVFREEGVQELSLGIAPFHNIASDPDERRMVRWLSRGFYNYGNWVYSFKNLAFHKSRYRPAETTWYLCMKDVGLFKAYWGLLFGLNAIGKKEL